MFHKKIGYNTNILHANSIRYTLQTQAGNGIRAIRWHMGSYLQKFVRIVWIFQVSFGSWGLCTFKEELSHSNVRLWQTLFVPLVCVNAAISIGYCGSKIKPLRLRLFWNRPSALIAALTHTRCTHEVFVTSVHLSGTVLLWTNKSNQKRPKRHLKNPIIRTFL